MEHTNQIAVQILNEEYDDYPRNSLSYDREYRIIMKALALQKDKGEDLFERIIQFQNETFPEATVDSCLNHLKEEILELEECIVECWSTGSSKYKLEIADCLMLIYGICNKYRIDYEGVVSLLEEKLQINLSRDWKMSDKGYTKHVEKESPIDELFQETFQDFAIVPQKEVICLFRGVCEFKSQSTVSNCTTPNSKCVYSRK
jgi:NTP pyrophosphatase (non-canonical NTP hydrolase)